MLCYTLKLYVISVITQRKLIYFWLQAADLTKYVDKKIYKGTNPTSHDFNRFTATLDSICLVVGFSTGPIQLFDPIKREEKDLKTFNEHTSIDKSKVTCVRWVPNSKNLFLASYASGHIYLFNQDLPCCISTPSYQPLQSGKLKSFTNY